MITSGSDISVVLSGGAANINPNDSLGGDPSSSPITSGALNNLFSDITSVQASTGHVDYRCIYIFNDGPSSIWDVNLWLSDPVDGSDMEIGIEDKNEHQRISITGPVTGGTLTLQYLGVEFTTSYNSDLAVWATEMGAAIQSIIDPEFDEEFFDEVTITGQAISGGTILFDIRWSGKDAKRALAGISSLSGDAGNLLEPEGSVTVTCAVLQSGAPVNTVASSINVDVTPPGGVSFITSSESSPLTIPRLGPDEGFPLWIKRSTTAGADAKESDGFSLQISAQSLEP